MAGSSSPQYVFLLLVFICNFIAIAKARAFVAQITSSGPALSPLYFASNLSIGTPPQPQKLLISTDAISYSWVTCSGPAASFEPRKSSSFRYLRCDRKPCYEMLKPHTTLTGRLAQDTFSLHTTNGSSQGAFAAVPKVTLACTDAMSALKLGFLGVASLTASKRGLPAQLGVTKFAYCLPRSPTSGLTPLFLGDGISYIFTSSPVLINISGFLAKAKLDVDERSGLLSVGLKNVSIEGEAVLSLRSPLKLQVSSVEPFTRLRTSVYVRMRAVFRAKAAARGIQEVGGRGQWDTCFNASTIGFSRVGPAVPPMELGLVASDGGVAAWSVFGFNSVVSVSDSVSCWAFLDAGARQPSVLGSFQQQGSLFEFDLAHRQLGFSGVLDFFRTTCSNFVF